MRPEQLAFFSSDTRAPLQERTQARAELESIYCPTSSELPSHGDMKQIVDAVLEWQADERFAKATQLQPMMGAFIAAHGSRSWSWSTRCRVPLWPVATMSGRGCLGLSIAVCWS